MSVRSTFRRLLGSLKNYLIKSYAKKRLKHDPTDSYFYLARQLAKCMMRKDALNLENYLVIMEMTGTKHIPTLQVCSTEKSELKKFLVNESLSHIYNTDKDKSKCIIYD